MSIEQTTDQDVPGQETPELEVQAREEQAATDEPQQTEQAVTGEAQQTEPAVTDEPQQDELQAEQDETQDPGDSEPGHDDAEGDTDADTETDNVTSTVTSVTSSTSESQDDLVRQGEIAADFLESLLDIADLDGDLEVDVEGNRAAVSIVDSEDGVAPRRLVGPGGSVLEALQELTRLAVQAETGERSRLMLDVAGYRSDRRATLMKTAQRAIAEVKESGSRQELEPMTAFERKVVHDEVLAAGLVSESEGAEPSRYVVILPPR